MDMLGEGKIEYVAEVGPELTLVGEDSRTAISPQAHLSRTWDEFALPYWMLAGRFPGTTRHGKANGRARLAEPKTENAARLSCPARGTNSPYHIGLPPSHSMINNCLR